MDKVVTYNLNEDFIENLAGFVEENFLNNGSDTSRLAFVFEGKRPAMFLRRALSKKMGKSFLSPGFFTIDEFVRHTLSKSKKAPFVKIPSMESWYAIYTLAKDIAPEIVKGRETFSQFLPWAREIANFIDLLDFEDIPSDSLKSVQASASIGYEIPPNINASLRNIIGLRNAYHNLLREKKSFSKGYIYLSAAKAIQNVNFEEFDRILFCGFFYIQKTERQIIKHLYDTGKAVLFFQGDEDKWPVLKEVSQYFSCRIKPEEETESNYRLNLYSAFDRHSQVCTVRGILKDRDKRDSTVIVLPDPESMIPLISEIGSSAGEFNVSLGYPLKRSSVHSLLEHIFWAQKRRRGAQYYAGDYIAALSQPLVKNLRVLPSHRATRVLVHKIEEALLGMEKTSISGNLFVKPDDLENENILFELASETLKHTDIEARPTDLQGVLKELHLLLFTLWESIGNFEDFAGSLGQFLDTLVKKSFISRYPLNLNIVNRIYSTRDELKNAPFSKESFEQEDIFKIFQDMLEGEMVAFSGSPLRGFQILGTLETRCLNFEDVIIMDMNESKLPELRIHEPLIPGEVIKSLGLDTIAREEERQRYLFTRMISGAKNVHLVYEENQEKERSRFIEQLIWQRQKEEESLNVISPPRVGFEVNMLPAKTAISKTERMVGFLKNLPYSPTSVDTYIRCPQRFYYRHVLKLKEKEELPEDPESKDIGTFIHKLLEVTFARFINKKPKIDENFRKDFFKVFDEEFETTFSKRMRSDSFLLKNIMRFRLKNFLEFEGNRVENGVREILLLEKKFNEKLELSGDTFNFVYKADRVDRLEDGSVLILDYKTGGSVAKPQGTDSLEEMELTRESIKDRIKSFQLPLYYYFEKRKHHGEDVKAAFYGLRSPKLTYLSGQPANLERTIGICMEKLDFILHEIVNPDKQFMADREERYCEHCPFFYMCR